MGLVMETGAHGSPHLTTALCTLNTVPRYITYDRWYMYLITSRHRDNTVYCNTLLRLILQAIFRTYILVYTKLARCAPKRPHPSAHLIGNVVYTCTCSCVGAFDNSCFLLPSPAAPSSCSTDQFRNNWKTMASKPLSLRDRQIGTDILPCASCISH